LKGVTIAVRISPSTQRFYETERQAPSMLKEFRDFLMRGNLVELAVAFVMGLAFATLVTAFVDGLVMPVVAMIIGKPDFSDLTFTINDAVFRYGAVLTAAITFVTTAAAIFFFVVKPIDAIRSRSAAADDEPSDDERRHQELLEALEGLKR
jgi:large conductance mechanosensitive channel